MVFLRQIKGTDALLNFSEDAVLQHVKLIIGKAIQNGIIFLGIYPERFKQEFFIGRGLPGFVPAN